MAMFNPDTGCFLFVLSGCCLPPVKRPLKKFSGQREKRASDKYSQMSKKQNKKPSKTPEKQKDKLFELWILFFK